MPEHRQPTKQRFNIQHLLDHGVQPWGPLPDETFDAIAEGILNRNGQILVPVIISARGRLIDGHHRLLAAQRFGKTEIGPSEYRIDYKATDSESEYLAAVEYQRNRRHTGMEHNAHVARDMMRLFNWSQGTVAEKMKVSPAAVSQWLSKFPDTSGEMVTTRTGRDGKTYDVTSVATPEEDREAPKRRSMKGPDAIVAGYKAAIANSEFEHFCYSWCATSEPQTIKRLAADLDEIARACVEIGDTLRAMTKPGADEPFGELPTEPTKKPSKKAARVLGEVTVQS